MESEGSTIAVQISWHWACCWKQFPCFVSWDGHDLYYCDMHYVLLDMLRMFLPKKMFYPLRVHNCESRWRCGCLQGRRSSSRSAWSSPSGYWTTWFSLVAILQNKNPTEIVEKWCVCLAKWKPGSCCWCGLCWWYECSELENSLSAGKDDRGQSTPSQQTLKFNTFKFEISNILQFWNVYFLQLYKFLQVHYEPVINL